MDGKGNAFIDTVIIVLNVLVWYRTIILSRPGQNGHHFADDIFKYIFMNANNCILIGVSLKFVPGGPIENTSA